MGDGFNPASKEGLAALLAEFFGTWFIVMFATYYQALQIELSTSTNTNIAFVYAFIYAVTSLTLGKYSGGHFNPALTIGAAVTRQVGLVVAALYILVQLIGGIVGSAVVFGLLGQEEVGDLAHNEISANLPDNAVFGTEIVGTFLIAFVWFNVINDEARPFGQLQAPAGALYVAFAYFVAANFTRFASRISLNPARSFGPAVIDNYWTHHWAWWFGPIIGVLLAVLLQAAFKFLNASAASSKVGP